MFHLARQLCRRLGFDPLSEAFVQVMAETTTGLGRRLKGTRKGKGRSARQHQDQQQQQEAGAAQQEQHAQGVSEKQQQPAQGPGSAQQEEPLQATTVADTAAEEPGMAATEMREAALVKEAALLQHQAVKADQEVEALYTQLQQLQHQAAEDAAHQQHLLTEEFRLKQERDAAEMQLNRMLARSITAPAAMVPAAAHRNSSSGSSGGNFLFPRRTSQQLFAAIPTTQQAAADAVQANPQEQYYREQLEESQAELAALEDKLSIEKEQLWLMQHGTAELEANTEELQQQVDWLQDQAAEVEELFVNMHAEIAALSAAAAGGPMACSADELRHMQMLQLLEEEAAAVEERLCKLLEGARDADVGAEAAAGQELLLRTPAISVC